MLEKDTDDNSPDHRPIMHLEKDTIALAAGTVTAALAANAAAMGAASSPEKASCQFSQHIGLLILFMKIFQLERPTGSLCLCHGLSSPDNSAHLSGWRSCCGSVMQ